jgi:hypothetical protein
MPDQLAALRARRSAAIQAAERDLLDRLETALYALEDLN